MSTITTHDATVLNGCCHPEKRPRLPSTRLHLQLGKAHFEMCSRLPAAPRLTEVRVEAGDRGPKRQDDADSTFAALRRRLFGIAYRVLGSSAEAEDVVQEAWLRWRASGHDAVRDSTGFLATTTTRLALNVAQSARSRRETYVGQWLPEPVDTRDDPALGAARSEALELAVLLLLEKLRPRERAVYVLSEAFEYPYAQIAEMLETTETNARQLASRARKLLGRERRRSVSAEEHRRLLEAFLAAARAGDRAGLEQLLVCDAVSYSDGGGIAVARTRSRCRVLDGVYPRARASYRKPQDAVEGAR